MSNESDVASLIELLPVSCPTLRTRREYVEWKESTLQPAYPQEYDWLEQYGNGGKECFYDIIDDLLPEDFRLEERRIRREGWTYAGDFAIAVMEVIREHRLYETFLLTQTAKGAEEENLVLVRPVLGKIEGRGIITAGRGNPHAK